MKAMILAGGLSTRLYPLTKSVPKPLVPVAGVPNAAHLMHYLKAYGFDEIAINVHYLADAIVEALGDGSRYGVKLHYSYESELLGSAGGLKKVQEFFDDEPFAVIGCDEVTDIRLDKLLEFHRDRAAIATIGLVECDVVDQYGVVVLDERAKIVGFQEKPPRGTERSKLANTGVYVFSPRDFRAYPASRVLRFRQTGLSGTAERGRALLWISRARRILGRYRHARRIPARELRRPRGRRADSQDHVEWYRLLRAARQQRPHRRSRADRRVGDDRRRRVDRRPEHHRRSAYASMPRRRSSAASFGTARRSARERICATRSWEPATSSSPKACSTTRSLQWRPPARRSVAVA